MKDRSPALWRNEAFPSFKKMATCLLAAILCVGLMPRIVYAEGASGDVGATPTVESTGLAGSATLQIVHGLDGAGAPQVLVNTTYGFYEGATYADLLDAAVAAGDIDAYSLNDYGFLASLTTSDGTTVAGAADSSTYWSNYENGTYYGGAYTMANEPLVDGTSYQLAWNSYPTAAPPTDWSSLGAAGTGSTMAGDESDTPSVDPDPIDQTEISTLFTAIAASYAGATTDWKAMDLAAAGRGSTADRDAIVGNAVDAYNDPDGTNLQRSIIALTALGVDASNVESDGATYDLVGKLATTPVAYDSIYGKAFALLAYQCGPYEVPAGALETRESLIDDLLASQAPDGGFAYSGTSSDADTTAMMIPALASSYESDATVRTAVDRALTALRGMEQPDGGFASTLGAAGSNVSSTAMVVVALCSLGLDPSEQWTTESGDTPLSALMSFANASATGFTYGGVDNDFATEQGFRALVAYRGFVNTGTAYNIYTQAKDGVAGLGDIPSDDEPTAVSSAVGSTLAQTGDAGSDATAAVVLGSCVSAAVAFAARRRVKSRCLR